MEDARKPRMRLLQTLQTDPTSPRLIPLMLQLANFRSDKHNCPAFFHDCKKTAHMGGLSAFLEQQLNYRSSDINSGSSLMDFFTIPSIVATSSASWQAMEGRKRTGLFGFILMGPSKKLTPGFW